MSEWSHGYNIELGYTYGYFRELAPSWLDFVAQIKGCSAPCGKKIRYLELACGQGVGLILLAATHPDIDFLGVDFSPAHIAHARSLASDAGLSNIRFEEADFLSLGDHWPTDYGQFQYVVAHGIYSWISPAVRASLVNCFNHAILPGGLAYISYNALPGWISTQPIQHLLRRQQLSRNLSPLDAIEKGITLLSNLREAGSILYAMCNFIRLNGQQAVQIERLATLAEVKPNADGMSQELARDLIG